MKPYVVLRDPGSAWVPGLPTREQPLWDEHAAFMDALFDAGRIMLGGPFSDWSGALVIFYAEDEAAAQAMFADDPWTLHDILKPGQPKAWTIFLDSRAQQPS